MSTLKLRKAAIRYLHYLAHLPSPTGTADVAETLARIAAAHWCGLLADAAPRR